MTRIPNIKTSVSTSYDLWINLDGVWRKLKTFKQANTSHSRSAKVDRVIDSEVENGYREMIPELETYKLTLNHTRLQKENSLEALGFPYPTDRLIDQDTPFEVEKREYFSDGSVRIIRYLDCWISSWNENVSIDSLASAESINLEVGRIVSR